MGRRLAVVQAGNGTMGEVDPSTIDSVVADPGSLLWLDIAQPSDDDVTLLRDEFCFHELALEDALRRSQRPKVDEYDGYYFIVLYSASTVDGGQIDTHEVHCFWGKNYVVTLHDDPVIEIEEAIKRWQSSSERRRFGVASQVYSLLDAVIDGYFPVLDAMAERVEDLESRVFESRQPAIREVFEVRKALIGARRVMGPSRDVLNVLTRRDVAIFPSELVPYLADVYDHSIRVIDALDLQRELLSSVIESHLSIVSNRLNETMRTLTALTIGVMVPTLIAGIYGMNFHFMPELEQPWGYPAALGLMAASMVGSFLLFRRVGWL
ncbi:MAG: magnesium and cobalt transport protein CorA [Chloroflexi bacterium]|nr:magnesium and cobalt transport protein CorA [Chloroflexota bacterium]